MVVIYRPITIRKTAFAAYGNSAEAPFNPLGSAKIHKAITTRPMNTTTPFSTKVDAFLTINISYL